MEARASNTTPDSAPLVPPLSAASWAPEPLEELLWVDSAAVAVSPRVLLMGVEEGVPVGGWLEVEPLWKTVLSGEPGVLEVDVPLTTWVPPLAMLLLVNWTVLWPPKGTLEEDAPLATAVPALAMLLPVKDPSGDCAW